MKSQTEEILWIGVQEEQIFPKEIANYAINNKISFIDLLEYTEKDFVGISASSVKKFFEKTEKINVDRYQNIWNNIHANNTDLIPYDHIEFPAKLRELETSPTILLYRRGEKIPHDNCIAIVGTRNCSAYAAEFTRILSSTVAKEGNIVVAGLAAGIDTVAHRGALNAGGKTIAVLAWMYDPYPKENRRLLEEITHNGFALSDTYFTTQGSLARAKFVHRNEIISGISDILVAVESSNTGGTVHQVEIAKRQNKTIITLEPQDDNPTAKKGFNRFLELGAIPVNSVEDVLEILNKRSIEKEKQEKITLKDFA